MLRFTSAGVVAAPRAVQVRVGPERPDALAVGIDVPDEVLDDGAIEANLRHFTLGQRGPRGAPCDAAILSGVPAGRLGGVAARVRAARAWGITRAVLHAPREALGEVDDAFDEVVVVSDGRPLEPCARPVTLVVPLVLGIDPAEVGRAASGATRVVLTWPFLADRRHPASGLPHLLSEIQPFLDDLGTSWSVKGAPGCVLGPHQGRHARTRNRWYVDGAHQMGSARLFFPDVLQFSKYDVCRFCLLDERCDGVTAKPGGPRPDVSVSPVVDS